MKRFAEGLVLAAGMLLVSGVQAQETYVCKDANGRTLTSDRPIPECADRVQRVLGKNGTTVRVIEPPPTAEQLKQRKAEEERLKAEKAAAEEKKRQDTALLTRYKSEQDIEVARKKTIETLQDQIKREEGVLAQSEKRLKEARADAEFYKKQKNLPPMVQHKIDDAEQSMKTAKKNIADRQAELAQVNTKFDQTLKRYRELVAGQTPAVIPVSASDSGK